MGALAVLGLENGVELELHAGLIVKELLKLSACLELLVRQTEQFQGLIVRHEATFDAQALVCDLFPNHVEPV